MSVLIDILLLILILCVIVVVHEGGHAIVARLFGMRVSEFFVGMPLGPRISFVSKKSGIRYGVTAALAGGYTRICGMAQPDDPRLPLVLEVMNLRGSLSVSELCRVLRCDEEEASFLLMTLEDLGSVERVVQDGDGEYRKLADRYRTVERDECGKTIRDRNNKVSLEVAHHAGQPFDSGMSPDDFLKSEKAKTYAGSSFIQRLCVLAAGPLFNLILAFVLIVACLTAQTFYTVAPGISGFSDVSPAREAGMQVGDVVVSVNGTVVDGYWQLGEILDSLNPQADVDVVVERDGARLPLSFELSDGKMGVTYAYEPYRMGVVEAASVAIPYIGQVAATVLSLLDPTHTQEVLSSSAGVVGITVMTESAVNDGPWTVLLLMGMLSLSLCWMNLLPIPPLDGGKIVLETVSKILGRPVPIWVQNMLSLVGIALFLMLFFYMVVQDVSRLV